MPDDGTLPTGNAENFERIVALIHKKHGVSISHDDPLLIVYTLHDDLIARLAASQDEILRRFEKQVEDVSERWKGYATNKAEQTLTTAFSAAKSRIEMQSNLILDQQKTILSSVVAEAVNKIELANQSVKYPIYVVIAAAIVCLMTNLLVLFHH